ncbi:MAG: LuxR family transcriptional regulator [Lachnospiraceae bacterium]|nr:LuxR family transcriptional regulator [Lachnospiraceae bacterium]
MEEFIFFNQRLTDKLNAIFKYPFTMVCGGEGVGKTFAIQKYLAIKNHNVIWHVIKEKPFSVYIREFMDYFDIDRDNLSSFCSDDPENMSPSDCAVALSLIIRKKIAGEQISYVLEYMGEDSPSELFEFLFYLTNQRVPGFHIILILRQCGGLCKKKYLDDSTNFISEDYFLLEPREIGSAFMRKGISLGTEEAQWFYLMSEGWMPVVKALYEEIKHQGKELSYQSMEETSSEIKRLCGRTDLLSFHGTDTDTGETISLFDDAGLLRIRGLIDAYELNDAELELAKEEFRVSGFSPEADSLVYCRAILLSLRGKAKSSFDILKEAFWLRVRENAPESAYRILIGSIQLRIFLGDKWFEEEKELISCFVNRSLNGHVGITGLSCAVALWMKGEYHRLISLIEGGLAFSDYDLAYREFLLGASYKAIGFEMEAEEHLSLAMDQVWKNNVLLPAIFFSYMFPNIEKYGKTKKSADKKEEFLEKAAIYRRAIKKNHEGHFIDKNRSLTVRESEIAEYVGKGLSNKEVASRLNISENTVKASLKTIYRKLGIESRKDLL